VFKGILSQFLCVKETLSLELVLEAAWWCGLTGYTHLVPPVFKGILSQFLCVKGTL
jgi:hypothetical protein